MLNKKLIYYFQNIKIPDLMKKSENISKKTPHRKNGMFQKKHFLYGNIFN